MASSSSVDVLRRAVESVVPDTLNERILVRFISQQVCSLSSSSNYVVFRRN